MLSGKRILVTGANGGIGIGICEALLQNNANLVMFYHTKKNKIVELLENHSNLQNNMEFHQVDLLDSKKLETTLHTVLEDRKAHV